MKVSVMDKRLEENLRVKTAITEAFLHLLESSTAENISVSEITKIARVSRMAYYRNFTSKLEIIRFYYDEIIFHEMETMLINSDEEEINFGTKEYGGAFFTVMKRHQKHILMLEELGYSGMLLQAFNERNIDLAGDMPATSIRRYTIYYAAGASFNGMLEWLRSGCRESIEDMVNSMYVFMNSCFNKPAS